MPNWGAIANAAVQIGSQVMSLFGNNAKELNEEYLGKQFDYQSILQQRQQDWLEKMSSTAHQREMADLRAAGLNPLLTVMGGQGATTPSSGMGSVGLPSADASVMEKQNKVANALQLGQLLINQNNSINQGKLQLSQANLNDEQTQTERTKQGLNLMEQISKMELARNLRLENSVFEQRFNTWKQHMISEIGNNIASSAKMYNDITNQNQLMELERVKTQNQTSATEHENRLKEQKIQESKANEIYLNERSRGYTLNSPETYGEIIRNMGKRQGYNTVNGLRRKD